jgi:hypothetical protein
MNQSVQEVKHWQKFWIVSENCLVAMAATHHAAKIAAQKMSLFEPGTVFIAIARGIGNQEDEYSCWMNGKEI